MSSEKKRTHKVSPATSFVPYVKLVQKQVHPTLNLTSASKLTLNNFVRVIINRVITVSNLILVQKKKKTLSTKEIYTAVRLVLPGEIAKHAISEGTKAVEWYNNSAKSGKSNSGEKKGRGGKAKLVMSVARVENEMMRYSNAERKSGTAAVYLAAVCEYMLAEVLELAGNQTREGKRVQITPRDIKLAVENDDELNKFLKTSILAGGVAPNIHVSLLPKKKSKKGSSSDTSEH